MRKRTEIRTQIQVLRQGHVTSKRKAPKSSVLVTSYVTVRESQAFLLQNVFHLGPQRLSTLFSKVPHLYNAVRLIDPS